MYKSGKELFREQEMQKIKDSLRNYLGYTHNSSIDNMREENKPKKKNIFISMIEHVIWKVKYINNKKYPFKLWYRSLTVKPENYIKKAEVKSSASGWVK